MTTTPPSTANIDDVSPITGIEQHSASLLDLLDLPPPAPLTPEKTPPTPLDNETPTPQGGRLGGEAGGVRVGLFEMQDSGLFDSQVESCNQESGISVAPEDAAESGISVAPEDIEDAEEIIDATTSSEEPTPSSHENPGSCLQAVTEPDNQTQVALGGHETSQESPETGEPSPTPVSMTAAQLRVYIGGIDLATLTYAQKKAFLEVLEAKVRHEAENMLLAYAPYPKQLDFHAAGRTNRERLLMAANQCISPWSFLETPEGERQAGEVWRAAGGYVLAQVDGHPRSVPWQNGTLKSIEPAFRLILDNGRFLDCSSAHRVLTPSGWTSLAQLVSRGGGLRCSQKHEDFLASCVEDGYLDGQQLHAAQDTVQGTLQPQDDARPRSPLVFEQRDAVARIPERIRQRLGNGPLSISGDAEPQIADLFSQFSGPSLPQSALRKTGSSQVLQRFAIELGQKLQSGGEVDPGLAFGDFLQHEGYCGAEDMPAPRTWSTRSARQCLAVARPGLIVEELNRGVERIETFYPFEPPELSSGVKLLVVVPIGYQPIIDAQVPDFHNYFSGGVVSHNSGKTYSAAAETAFHLTGEYPEGWQGKVFGQPTRGLAAGITSQLVRDSMQVLLFGYPAKSLGEGMVPKRCIASEPISARSITGAFDTVKVKHVSGGESTLYLRAFEQGREKVQAMTLDFVWLDEEPDADYYTEALTRTNVSSGPVYMTFTPLKGMSETVARFLLEGHGHVTTMTLDDVDHYTPEQRAAIIAQYPAHERLARTKGIPTLGSGKVYPVAEEDITVEAFQIPAHWPRLAAMDFGWSHDTAVVWVAWDRDADTVYVYDTYNASETLIPVHASAIKARGDWINVSWPHDGMSVKDAQHGEPLAQQYRNEGVNMRPEHAAFPETQSVGERKMSRISTEAAIQEILSRMSSGRFKVFAHRAEWLQEFRLYHRKDGALVKLRDDLMSATHKAIMDLRFAITEPRIGKSIDHNRRSDWYM